MVNKHTRAIWDAQLDYIEELKKLESSFSIQEQRDLKRLIKMQGRVLHSFGYRPRYHGKNKIDLGVAESIPKQSKELPTAVEAKTKTEKVNPKRLGPQQASDIAALERKGKTAQEISNELMIVEEKVVKYLAKLKKQRQPKQLIHVTNGKNND